LDFLDLVADGYFDIFNGMGKIVQELHGDKTGNIADLRSALNEIAEKHVYFQFLRLEWLEKLAVCDNGRYECSVYDLIPIKAMTHIPMNIIDTQHRVKYMIEKAMSVADDTEDSIKERVASLYLSKKAESSKAFYFQSLSLGFECVDGLGIIEVLYPRSIFEIVDYFLRKAIQFDVGFKACRNCGKYFPDTAHGNTEFCGRLFQDTGKSCKDIGSLTKWKEKVAANPAILLYNKHYKTRFSRIKAGKVTREVFQEWAAMARAYRDKVIAGEMSLEDFEGWLKSGSWV
jgi:hypothetical protein